MLSTLRHQQRDSPTPTIVEQRSGIREMPAPFSAPGPADSPVGSTLVACSMSAFVLCPGQGDERQSDIVD
jgi:hypothetical protein